MRVLTGALFTYIGYYEIPKLMAGNHDNYYNGGINVRKMETSTLGMNSD